MSMSHSKVCFMQESSSLCGTVSWIVICLAFLPRPTHPKLLLPHTMQKYPSVCYQPKISKIPLSRWYFKNILRTNIIDYFIFGSRAFPFFFLHCWFLFFTWWAIIPFLLFTFNCGHSSRPVPWLSIPPPFTEAYFVHNTIYQC